MSNIRKIKVLICKTNLDGHWTGPLVVATGLRDAGMEVIYGDVMGPNEIAETAIQENVDAIGLHIGATYSPAKRIIEVLREKGLSDILIVAGGTIPRADIPKLKKMGISEVFPPGSTLESISRHILQNVKQAR